MGKSKKNKPRLTHRQRKELAFDEWFISMAENTPSDINDSAFVRLMMAYTEHATVPKILAERRRRRGDPTASPKDYACRCPVAREDLLPVCRKLAPACAYRHRRPPEPTNLYENKVRHAILRRKRARPSIVFSGRTLRRASPWRARCMIGASPGRTNGETSSRRGGNAPYSFGMVAPPMISRLPTSRAAGATPLPRISLMIRSSSPSLSISAAVALYISVSPLSVTDDVSPSAP